MDDLDLVLRILAGECDFELFVLRELLLEFALLLEFLLDLFPRMRAESFVSKRVISSGKLMSIVVVDLVFDNDRCLPTLGTKPTSSHCTGASTS